MFWKFQSAFIWSLAVANRLAANILMRPTVSCFGKCPTKFPAWESFAALLLYLQTQMKDAPLEISTYGFTEESCTVEDAIFCQNLRKLAKSQTNPGPPSFTIFMAAILSHLTALHILIIGVNPTLSGRIKNLAENIISTVKHEDGNSLANPGTIWAVVVAVVNHQITFGSQGEEALWLRNSTCHG